LFAIKCVWSFHEGGDTYFLSMTLYSSARRPQCWIVLFAFKSGERDTDTEHINTVPKKALHISTALVCFWLYYEPPLSYKWNVSYTSALNKFGVLTSDNKYFPTFSF
jgi:hypothetical protein